MPRGTGWAALVRRAASTAAAGAAGAAAQAGQPPLLPLSVPIACVWGANTGVGKTLISAGLAAACTEQQVIDSPPCAPVRHWRALGTPLNFTTLAGAPALPQACADRVPD